MTTARGRRGAPLASFASALLVAASAGAAERPFSNVCTFDAEDVSFQDAHVSVGGAVTEAEQAHAERATVFIEQNGTRARVRVHVIAPFDAELTTENFSGASLSLRAGANVGGVVTAEQAGAVRLSAVARDGRTMDLTAGAVTVRGLPLRCDDLIATKSSRSYGLHGTNILAGGLYRLHARPGDTGFVLNAPSDTLVSVDSTQNKEWTTLGHSGSINERSGFRIMGWVRGPRLRGPGLLGGGSVSEPGFRSCAPGVPERMGFATLDAGTSIYVEAREDTLWTKLTAPARALVATYPAGRVALAALPGWSWPRSRCALGWLDPAGIRIDEPERKQPDAPPPANRP
ncbi:MAG TPA: hypothetical protein VGP07_10465 [Polyangia bacterium]